MKRGLGERKVMKNEIYLPSEGDCNNAKVIEKYYFIILNGCKNTKGLYDSFSVLFS